MNHASHQFGEIAPAPASLVAAREESLQRTDQDVMAEAPAGAAQRSLGARLPTAAPESFAPVVAASSPQARADAMRTLQRSYGNRFAAQAAQAASLPSLE